MFATLKNAFKNKELRTKIFIILGLLVIFRIGCWLPVPGISVTIFKDQVNNQSFLSLLSGITGGALANGAVLALGVSPYITAQIVVQLLSMAIPSWERLSQQGEEGRKKLNKYTKILTLILATAQSIGIVVAFARSGGLDSSVFFNIEWLTGAIVVLTLVAGSMFTLWLGEKITDTGVVNGLSLLIFIGILSTAGTAIASSISNAISGNIDDLWGIIAFFVALIIIFSMIVLMDKAERKVPVQYAKQVRGRKLYGGQSTYIPVKMMGTGVLPIIFAMSLLSFPQIIFSIFAPDSAASTWYNTYLGAGSWAYSVIVGLLILGFAYFTSMMNFKPDDISRQIQSNGGFIPGIRPGKTTADYLNRINKRIVFFGACFLAFLTIVPTLVFKAIGDTGLVSAFSATGMIIVVSCALEINKGLEAQLLMKNYKGFLK
ncbi:MAG: preprotein translocase subunit SecY [Christensenellales bacterium]